MKILPISLILLILAACSEEDKPMEVKEICVIQPPDVVALDSIRTVNKCSNNSFISTLEEDPNVDSNAFVLTIKAKDGSSEKAHTLDARPGMSKINYCIEDYTVVGFSCGGPCYSQFFVFTKEDRPVEQYDFCQRVYSHPNIITHIKKEEFDTLTVHNFDNGKELKVDITDCKWGYYGHIDTMYMLRNNLILNYPLDDDHSKRKIVNLDPIIN